MAMEEDYKYEKQCEYKGEIYSVRDNGAVMRHSREGKRLRKDDDVWTFGKKTGPDGYMFIGAHRVHIIVAIAFLGTKNSKIYVVDHIDTNHCNNRVENLRWLTRLENALLNPITRKRITILCGGDILNFIKNPACLRDLTGTNKDIEWMRTVSHEEAANAYENIMALTAKPIKIQEKNAINKGGKLSNWIYEKKQLITTKTTEPETFIKAKYPETALQMNWKTPTDFPNCPKSFRSGGLKEYFENLKTGNTFSKNIFSEHIVMDKVLIENDTELLVVTNDLTEGAIKPYALAKIYCSGGQFIHQGISLFFEENGARQRFTEMQGLKWEGEDSIDNYC